VSSGKKSVTRANSFAKSLAGLLILWQEWSAPRIMPYRAQFEHWIPLPLESVFDFFGDPANLPRILPAWMQVKIEQTSLVAPPDAPPGTTFAGAGSSLLASSRALPFLPFRIRSEARIVCFGMNSFFEDVQGAGPFRSWHHRHEFISDVRDGVGGTLVRDRIEYEIGFEPAGRLINALFIAPQMRRIFAYRQQATERLLLK
jgi:ligand-binding SRPBCC domain-containing protein